LLTMICVACAPAVVAREPMATVGTGPVAELPAELAGYLQVTLRACLEELNPNNTCEDKTDRPLAGVTMPVKFGEADDESVVVHRLTTDESGIATVQVVMPPNYDGGTKSFEQPPEILVVTLRDGTTIFACVGRPSWLGTAMSETLTFPYSEENCTVPEKTAGIEPKRDGRSALARFAMPSNHRASKYFN